MCATIGHSAALLGEDEEWLHDLSTDMFPDDGCLHVYGVGEDGVTAFTHTRRIAMDTDRRPLMVNLTPAEVSDSAGAQAILAAVRKRWPWLMHLFADAGYDRTKLRDKAECPDFVRRSDKATGFEAVSRRWVVERTFGWMIRCRRLVRDYKRRLDVSEAMIHAAMGVLLLLRVAAQHRSNGVSAQQKVWLKHCGAHFRPDPRVPTRQATRSRPTGHRTA